MSIDLIKQIKAKKILANLDDSFINYHLDKYFKENPKLLKKIDKKKIRKKIIKDIRYICNKAYGMFITKEYFKKEKLLQQYKNNPIIGNLNKLLSIHKSTKERLPIYPEIYETLFSLTTNPKSVLDLGCGLNPLSIKYIKNNIIKKYYAYDISKKDLEFVKKSFNLINKNIKIITKSLNLLKIKDQTIKLPKTDICFMFKLLDHIDLTRGHKLSEKLMKAVNSKYIIISMPTVTLIGKKKKYLTNNWIKYMVLRNKWKFIKRFIIGNEEFFVVEK